MTTRDEMMRLLSEKWGVSFISTTEMFNGSPGGIWLSGENGETYKNGRELFYYYSYPTPNYIFGVLNVIHKWANSNGWYFSWNDPGTIMLRPIN